MSSQDFEIKIQRGLTKPNHCHNRRLAGEIDEALRKMQVGDCFDVPDDKSYQVALRTGAKLRMKLSSSKVNDQGLRRIWVDQAFWK
jgi:hypothetical protein